MIPGEKKFRNYRINFTKREQIEPEEIFFDNSKIKEFEGGEVDAGKFERPIVHYTFTIFGMLQIAVLFFVGSLTAFIILNRGADYIAQAKYNSSRTTPIFPARGIIYSSDNRILAQNDIYFDVIVNVSQLDLSDFELRDLSSDIGTALSVEEEVIYRKFLEMKEQRFSEAPLFKGISREELKKLEQYIISAPFFEIRQINRRNYPFGSIFAHIVGYTGEASSIELSSRRSVFGQRVGKAGIEAFYDADLRGETGFFIRKVNAIGHIFSQELQQAPQAGKDIVLNVNAELQQKVTEILSAHAKNLQVDIAVAILLDPQNGRIISLVGIPSFDTNIFEQGVEQDIFENLISDRRKPLFNRAISGEYPSGSIIKPIIAAAALEEKLVTPDFLVYSGGAIHVPSVYDKDVIYEFKDWKQHGWTDMRKAIADSVNIYFYTIGGGYDKQEGLGIRKIEKYLREFGWGEILGVDLPSEKNGFIPSPKWKKEQKGENWYIGDTYLASIGQGDILVTPLQVAAATAVFANKGKLFTPRIVSNINGVAIEPKILNQDFISKDHLDVVREGMRRAVTSGSSQFLRDLPYMVAGKTGTAQTGRGRNHAWFTGFAPFEDPAIVITVLLDEGKNSNYAVRAAKDILEAYFKIYPQNSRD